MYEILRSGGLGDRRVQLRHEAAPPVDRPRRPVPRARRRDRHAGQGAAGRRVAARVRASSRTPLRDALRGLAGRARGARSLGRAVARPTSATLVGDRGLDPHAGLGPAGAAREHRQPPHRAGPLGRRAARHGGRQLDPGHQGRGARRRRRHARRRRPGPAPGDAAAVQRAGTRRRGGPRSHRRWPTPARPDVAAISVAGQQHGMVLLDGGAERCARPSSGTTPSRRPRRPAWSTSSVREAWAAATGLGAPGRLHHHQARLDGGARTRGPRSALARGRAAPRLPHLPTHRPARDRPRRRIGHRLLRTPRTGGGGPTCSTGSSPRCRGPSSCRRSSARRRRPARSTRRPTSSGSDRRRGRPGTGRQHGRGARHRPRAGRGVRVARYLGDGLRDVATGPPPTPPARSPGSPTPPAATCRWCARSTPRRSPPPSPACSASTEPELGALALARPAGAGGRGASCRTSTASGPRTAPTPTGSLHGLRSDVSREALARAAFEGVVCGLLDGLDALRRRVELAVGPHRPRRRRRPVGGLPAGPGRPLGLRRSPCREHTEQVATGACVQAAAVLHGCPIESRPGRVGSPIGIGHRARPTVDAGAIRSAYAEARR